MLSGGDQAGIAAGTSRSRVGASADGRAKRAENHTRVPVGFGLPQRLKWSTALKISCQFPSEMLSNTCNFLFLVQVGRGVETEGAFAWTIRVRGDYNVSLADPLCMSAAPLKVLSLLVCFFVFSGRVGSTLGDSFDTEEFR